MRYVTVEEAFRSSHRNKLLDLLNEYLNNCKPWQLHSIQHLSTDSRLATERSYEWTSVYSITWFTEDPATADPEYEENRGDYEPNGFFYFTSERASSRSIAQKIGNLWYAINEKGPVTLEELERRGWKLDVPVCP